MGAALLQILPLALGAIAPTMIGLVVLFLSEDRGLVKALVFVLGKYILYVLLGLVSLDWPDIFLRRTQEERAPFRRSSF